MMATPSLQVDTEYPADVVQFCPARYAAHFAEACPEEQDQSVIFACGTYKLLEGDGQEKIGKLILGLLGLRASSLEIQLNKRKAADTRAILDLKWFHMTHAPLFMTADARGTLELYSLSPAFSVALQQSLSKNGPCGMCLSFDLEDHYKRTGARIVSSCSRGQLRLWDSASGSLVSDWDAHGNEAWCCAFDYWNPHAVFSGGDDCHCKIWDTRDLSCPVYQSKKYDMGVTSIASHPFIEHLLATGSYDQHIRVWDQRCMRLPLASSPEPTGGIWRLSWDPEHGESLLAACMYGGVSVYTYSHLDRHEPRLSLDYRYGGHTSIVYGTDWIKGHSGKEDGYLVGSCSFYDASLQFWYYNKADVCLL